MYFDKQKFSIFDIVQLLDQFISFMIHAFYDQRNLCLSGGLKDIVFIYNSESFSFYTEFYDPSDIKYEVEVKVLFFLPWCIIVFIGR